VKIRRRGPGDESGLMDISDPVIRRVLAGRGVKSSADAFCTLAGMEHYRSLPDIGQAAQAIADAVEGGSRILVFGDYDVDGVTGAALGQRVLYALGAAPGSVSCTVPSRYEGGYGLSPEAVEAAASDGVRLIVTVDNGIGCAGAAEAARERGITLVVTDHHECPPELPEAEAVVDPKRPDSLFPSKALCGAGVLFYVLCAVRSELDSRGFYRTRRRPVMADFLDLVTLGTVGDVVPFDANNRRMVKAGLERLRRGRTVPGILALARRSRCDLATLNPRAIGFDLCPKINAAGRIKLDGNPALDLLLTDDPKEAEELSERLDMANRRRGDYERVFCKEAAEDAAAMGEVPALTLYRPDWLPGIAGLIAGRLKDRFGVPCFVFTGREGGELKGSARSLPGVPLGEILDRIRSEDPGLLLAGGGHAMAAGATIRPGGLEEFRRDFGDLVAQYRDHPAEQETVTDGELPASHLTLAFARELERCGPWGEGFPEPLFDGEFEVMSVHPIQNRHLRFVLRNRDGQRIQAIRLRALVREKALQAGIAVRAVYAVEVNRYMGTERLQVRLEGLEPV
jgi:single-stranded-DNA-specific exonuclease